MSMADAAYFGLLQEVREDGISITTRNEKVKRVTNVAKTFHDTPLISLRKTAWLSALREWEWFMSGSNSVNELHESVRHWWQPWASPAGLIHGNYSVQFRRFNGGFDQITALIDGIKNHPFSRRNCITTWHSEDMYDTATPITNCHGSFIQAFVDDENRLDLTMYQRSCDVVCGVPHNWIQYWAFLMWLAHRTGRRVGALTWIGGDVHVYGPHESIVDEIFKVCPNIGEAWRVEGPSLFYRPTSTAFLASDFKLDGEYKPLVTTKAVMVV